MFINICNLAINLGISSFVVEWRRMFIFHTVEYWDVLRLVTSPSWKLFNLCEYIKYIQENRLT